MSISTSLLISLGSAIAKSLLKIWTKDNDLLNNTTSDLLDLFKAKTTEIWSQLDGIAQFQKIGELVINDVLKLVENNGAVVNKESVIIALSTTLNESAIDMDLLIKNDLDPIELAKYLEGLNKNIKNSLNETESNLYSRALKEICSYVVTISQKFPAFESASFSKVLSNEKQLLKLANEALDNLRHIRQLSKKIVDEEQRAERDFMQDYRDAVFRKLNRLELFGLEISPIISYQNLDIAYVQLKLTPQDIDDMHYPVPRSKDTNVSKIETIETLLTQFKRIVITGTPGCGKTTLLQWIAVRSVIGFPNSLAKFNNFMPFFIQLRKFAKNPPFPKPEDFPSLISQNLSDLMPEGWVYNQLKYKGASYLPNSISYERRHNNPQGAFILIDGIDEVSANQRLDLLRWIEDLVASFPDAYLIITSRHSAIDKKWTTWFKRERFRVAEIQPMDIHKIRQFIQLWHKAVERNFNDLGQPVDLTQQTIKMQAIISEDSSKRLLASTPLLCAMLCALYKDGRYTNYTSDRRKVYESFIEVLLEKRDQSRNIASSEIVLSYGQKLIFLRDFAYWLFRNEQSEIDIDIMDKSFDAKIPQMAGDFSNISGKDIRLLLTARSGIIVQASAESVVFLHRTFQEYFAAVAAVYKSDIPFLINKAHEDIWREVIILASGIMGMEFREKLINGILKRGNNEIQYRRYLYLLALACFGMSLEVKRNTYNLIKEALLQLEPPNNIMEAYSIATFGVVAIELLKYKPNNKPNVLAMSVTALGLIGGSKALKQLELYALDSRPEVFQELLRVWTEFEEREFLEKVLSKSNTTSAHITSKYHLLAITYLKELTNLVIEIPNEEVDLSILDGLANLTEIKIINCNRITNIDNMPVLPNLMFLELIDLPLRDLTPLEKQPRLRSVIVEYYYHTHVIIPESIADFVTVNKPDDFAVS